MIGARLIQKLGRALPSRGRRKFREACDRYVAAKKAYARARARYDTRAMHAASAVLQELSPIILRGHV